MDAWRYRIECRREIPYFEATTDYSLCTIRCQVTPQQLQEVMDFNGFLVTWKPGFKLCFKIGEYYSSKFFKLHLQRIM